jgi:hypothetical protein
MSRILQGLAAVISMYMVIYIIFGTVFMPRIGQPTSKTLNGRDLKGN